MAKMAWACLVNLENKQAIISEHPGFDEESFEQWLKDHPIGYFIRDEESPFDCKYMSKFVFERMYEFTGHDELSIFRSITATG